MPLATLSQLASRVGIAVGGTGDGVNVGSGVLVARGADELAPAAVTGPAVGPPGVANEIKVGKGDPFGIAVGKRLMGVAFGSKLPPQPATTAANSPRVRPLSRLRIVLEAALNGILRRRAMVNGFIVKSIVLPVATAINQPGSQGVARFRLGLLW